MARRPGSTPLTWMLTGLMLLVLCSCKKEEEPEDLHCEDEYTYHPFPDPSDADWIPMQWASEPEFLSQWGHTIVFNAGQGYGTWDCPADMEQMRDCGPGIGFYVEYECFEQKRNRLRASAFDEVEFMLSVQAHDGVRVCMITDENWMGYCLEFDPSTPPAMLDSVVINGSVFQDVYYLAPWFYFNKDIGIVGFTHDGHIYALQP